MNKLVASTYRQIMKTATAVDRDPALRAFISCTPQRIYDHSSDTWRDIGTDLAEQWPEGRRHVEEAIRKLNDGLEFYHPESLSQEASKLTLAGITRQKYREGVFTPSSLNTAFAGIKYLNAIKDIQKLIPKKPKFDAKENGLRTVPVGEMAKTVPDPMGESLALASKSRRMTLLAAHPLLPGFFKNSLILISRFGHESSIGLIINKPLTTDDGTCIPVWSVVPDNFHPIFTNHLAGNPVMLGGPVASPMSRQQALYVCHTVPGIADSCPIAPGVYISGDLDQLTKKLEDKEIAPKDVMVLMGYSGWGTEQLQGEILSGSWTVLIRDAVSDAPVANDATATATDASAGEKSEASESEKLDPKNIQDETVAALQQHHIDLAQKEIDEVKKLECLNFIMSPHIQCLATTQPRPDGEDDSASHRDDEAAVPTEHPRKSWEEVVGGLGEPYSQMARLAELPEDRGASFE